MSAKCDAEARIAEILAELEAATGQWVEQLCVEDLDITAYTDKSQQLQRRVVIKLRAVPGSHWQTT